MGEETMSMEQINLFHHGESSVYKKNQKKLLDLAPGVESVIARINTKDTKILKKLMSMGILPGMPVQVIQKTPSVVFKVGNTTLAVDKDIASNIEVDDSMQNSKMKE
jgi:Fe2+ transport system protein FeoA